MTILVIAKIKGLDVVTGGATDQTIPPRNMFATGRNQGRHKVESTLRGARRSELKEIKGTQRGIRFENTRDNRIWELEGE